jgi:hypothetical protein
MIGQLFFGRVAEFWEIGHNVRNRQIARTVVAGDHLVCQGDTPLISL